MAILEVQGVTKRYGGLTAVNNVSFLVEKGEILSIIGPNGAVQVD
jgi:branched-chain amino acid transport system ATP-binding protein